MAEQQIETSWRKVGPKQYEATVESEELGRRIVHEYLICRYVVVEVDKLFEEGKPMAVFRTPHTADEMGDFDDEEELAQILKELALDAPEFQIVEEFDVSIQTFETST